MYLACTLRFLADLRLVSHTQEDFSAMSTHFRRMFSVAVLVFLTACADDRAPVCVNPAPGFLVTNVSLVDGSGAAPTDADVRVTDGMIAAVGALDPCPGEGVIDGNGLTLAPGFIDTHSHADSDDDLFTYSDALPVISQGITTIVIGQDGGSPLPLADFFAKLEASPATVNVASYSGHNTLRYEVMGEDFKRVATENEIDAMATLLQADLDAGALGLSAGLEYEPGIHSETSEVLELAQLAADAGGRYISHVRSEDRWFEDAIDEIVLIGRETGMPVQVSHIKLAMKRLWGTADQVIAKLNAARADGIDITADIYPYEYWQSTMMVLLPDRDPTNRETIAHVLDQIAPPEGMWFTRFEPEPSYVGKTLAEIAAIRETDVVTAFSELALEALAMQEEGGQRVEMIIGTSMEESDVIALLKWPHTNVCTDGGIDDLHPRARGAFPRVLGRYVREQGALSLEAAVHRMTGLAAEHMGFTDRGLVREGMVADLVLFDPDTIIDRATPADPDALSVGVSTVWVGGDIVFTNGAATEARPGRVIRRESP